MNIYIDLDTWNTYGRYAAYLMLAISLIIIFYHLFSLTMIRDYKKRYDYLNKHEISNYWYASVFLLIAIGIYINTLVPAGEVLWVGVRNEKKQHEAQQLIKRQKFQRTCFKIIN
jgi:hypothetical protein